MSNLDWLDEVIRVRRSIGDPIAVDFTVVETLPETAQPDAAFTTGDGRYWFHDGAEWRQYALKFSDVYIRLLASERGRLKASIRLIDDLVARIDPTDYLVSGNAGGQSVSFPSLSELTDFYKRLKDSLLAEEAAELGMNSGLMLETKRRPVGGVMEEKDDEIW